MKKMAKEDEMGRKRERDEKDYQRKRKRDEKKHRLLSYSKELHYDPLALTLAPPSTRHRYTLPPPPPPLPLPPLPRQLQNPFFPPPPPHSPLQLPPLPIQLQNPFSPPPPPTPPPYTLYFSPSNIVNPPTPTLVPNPATTTQVASSPTSTTLVAGPLTSAPLTANPERAPQRNFRTRRNPTQAPRGGKSAIIPPPYPWATDRRATVYSLDHLLKIGIEKISGAVQCKGCELNHEIEFDLQNKFFEVANYIAANKSEMHDRAPKEWMSPLFPTCSYCEQENSLKPIIAAKKKNINWLFLLLGQLLGCCTLEQLKYFCKHTKNHRTGAKDRVLYLTYLGLCKQLCHSGPFDR